MNWVITRQVAWTFLYRNARPKRFHILGHHVDLPGQTASSVPSSQSGTESQTACNATQRIGSSQGRWPGHSSTELEKNTQLLFLWHSDEISLHTTILLSVHLRDDDTCNRWCIWGELPSNTSVVYGIMLYSSEIQNLPHVTSNLKIGQRVLMWETFAWFANDLDYTASIYQPDWFGNDLNILLA